MGRKVSKSPYSTITLNIDNTVMDRLRLIQDQAEFPITMTALVEHYLRKGLFLQQNKN